MSGIYIHKASNKYVILSLAFLLLVLFSYFSIQFNLIPFQFDKTNTYSHYIELQDDWETSSADELISRLKKDVFKDGFIAYTIKDKEQSWKALSKNYALEFASNPLNNIIVISAHASGKEDDISMLVKNFDEIRQWNIIEETTEKAGFQIGHFSIVLLPIIIIAFILYLSILQGAANSNLSSNKRVLESLMLSGAHHTKITSVFRANALTNFSLAFILSLFLYIIIVYIIIKLIGVGINHISLSNAMKAVLLPSTMLLALHLVILLWKVDKFLKSI